MKMNSSACRVFVFILCALVHGAYSLEYSDLEALELACPARDSCDRYRNNVSYLDRSCECDSACDTYRDCCIDANRTRSNGGQLSSGSAPRNGMVCMRYGAKPHAGVYVIAHCKRNWNGSPEVREKCEGSQDDFSDPLVAAPVTSIAEAVTYRNRYCAECNNADPSSLTLFRILVGCEGLPDLPNEQILADITYDRKLNMWGVNRLNSFGNRTLFHGCVIAFDVPGYLNSSVRFCRSEVISTCMQNWDRPYVKEECEDYMAVVFDNFHAYRNPQCAICNNKTIDQLSCTGDVINRKRPMSFALLLDINRDDGDLVGMGTVATPECPGKQKYDPFFEKCRRLMCALPGYKVVNGRCVSGS